LTLLKNAQFIIGNSSAGIREAPYYGIPIINVGTRQQNRTVDAEIINVNYEMETISEALKNMEYTKKNVVPSDFGNGNSTQLFVEAMNNSHLWAINHQKQFNDN
jgi:UDP-N-acetylglucosamine 2-epimerase (hydrolysing)